SPPASCPHPRGSGCLSDAPGMSCNWTWTSLRGNAAGRAPRPRSRIYVPPITPNRRRQHQSRDTESPTRPARNAPRPTVARVRHRRTHIGEHEHFDLVEPVHPENTARVFAVRTGFATEARAERNIAARQG